MSSRACDHIDSNREKLSGASDRDILQKTLDRMK